MGSRKQLKIEGEPTVHLGEAGVLKDAVHVFDRDSALAVNTALAAKRPLLVRGEPGCGKSQLGRAVAAALGRAFVSKTVDAQTEPRDLLWTIDTVARLADGQLVAHHASMSSRSEKSQALSEGDDDVRGSRCCLAIDELLDECRYVVPGPLWWAFDGASAGRLMDTTRIRLLPPFHPQNDWSINCGAVVLIDEIDKADSSVPNGLLEALGSGRFEAPGMENGVAMDFDDPPLVVVTTNAEKMLPDAFLRRCVVLQIDLPEDIEQFLIGRGRAHFPKCAQEVLEKGAELLARERAEMKRRGLSPPGQAEYLDLIRAICELCKRKTEQLALMGEVAKFTFVKHPPEGK